jgi:tetratricopeptide (TPR) repeat protein
MVLLDIFSTQDTAREWLANDCLRRAALNYEQAELWMEAAACWSEAGEPNKAAELYLRLNDYGQSAALLLSAGRYSEALEQYNKWLDAAAAEDSVSRVTALLGISLCHMKMESNSKSGRDVYRAARGTIEAVSDWQDALTIGRCWEAFAQYGLSIERTDILQVAYEKALANYGTQYNVERVRAAQAYLEAIKGNRLLREELTERLAEWRQGLPVVDRSEVEPGRHAAFIARGRAGNVSDVDYLMHMLESEPRVAIYRLVDYALGLVQTSHGEERIKHYLFNGTETQRNYAALYFKRMGSKWQRLLIEAFNQGKIDRAQAFAK